MKYKQLYSTLLLFLALGSPFYLAAQLGEANNGNPPNLEWQEISNESARIIFPKGLDKQAERVADIIDYLNKNNRTSIGELTYKKPIDIILQNQLTESNGFVTAAPFRSEFFTTAPQRGFAGTNDWMDELAIHEYRHVLQLHNSRQGLTKLGKKLFGESTWIGLAFFSTPFWFTEGDAVMQETLLSKAGRGRSAGFLTQYRALHEAGIKYSYEKIRNNSYKSFLPDRYKTGYLMSLYGRKRFGNNMWKGVAGDAVKYKGLFWSFSQGLKKRTNMHSPQFYDWMIDSLYQDWDAQKSRDSWTIKTQTINQPIPSKNPTFYGYPKFISPNELLFVKSSFSDISKFYTQKKGSKIQRLFTLGYQDSYCNYKNGKLVWAETTSDIRWPNKTFSVIYIYDFKTHKKRKLTHKTKLFSPDINSDGSKIIAIKSDELMQYQAQIIDAQTGAIVSKIPNPKNILLSSPRWLDQQTIVAIAQHHNQNALVQVDITSGRMSPIIDYTANLMSNPAPSGQYVLFTADFQEVRNIYAVDIRTKEIFQVTHSMVSANHVDVSKDQQWIVFAERQINGRDIKKMAFNPEKWRKIIPSEPIDRYTELLPLMKFESNILDKIPAQKYVVQKFNRKKDFIKFHSWTPTIIGRNRYGLNLHSTNLLATTDIHIKPNASHEGYGIQSEIVYNKYLPKLSISHDIGTGKIQLTDSSEVLSYNWNKAFATISVPLIFSKNAYYRLLTFKASGGLTNYNFDTESPLLDSYQYGIKINYLNYQHRSRQQIATRFGQAISIGISNRQLSNQKQFQVLESNANLYLPGLTPTHSLQLKLNYTQVFGDSKRVSIFTTPRGYSAILGHDKGMLSTIEYALPLAYPDRSVSSLLFFKRIRSHFFFDYSYDFDQTGYYSTGVELITDIGLLRFGDVFNFPIGIRVSYLNGVKSDIFGDHIRFGLVL